LSSKSTFSNSTSKSYAMALYELSKGNSELDKVEDGMKSLNRLLNDSTDFRGMISNPMIALYRKNLRRKYCKILT